MNTFRLAAEDFRDALHFLLKNKVQYQIDESKIIVGGSSAGAEVILNAVYHERLMFDDKPYDEKFTFTGVISLAGAVVDARYSTLENAVSGVFFYGTNDNLVPYGTGPHHRCDPVNPGYIILDGSHSIVERLRKLNTSYLLYSFEGGGHEHSGSPLIIYLKFSNFLRR